MQLFGKSGFFAAPASRLQAAALEYGKLFEVSQTVLAHGRTYIVEDCLGQAIGSLAFQHLVSHSCHGEIAPDERLRAVWEFEQGTEIRPACSRRRPGPPAERTASVPA